MSEIDASIQMIFRVVQCFYIFTYDVYCIAVCLFICSLNFVAKEAYGFFSVWFSLVWNVKWQYSVNSKTVTPFGNQCVDCVIMLFLFFCCFVFFFLFCCRFFVNGKRWRWWCRPKIDEDDSAPPKREKEMFAVGKCVSRELKHSHMHHQTNETTGK